MGTSTDPRPAGADGRGLIEARTGSGSYVAAMVAARHLEHDRLHFPGSPFGLAGPDGADRPDGSGGPAADRLSWEHQTLPLVPPPHIARRLGLVPGAPAKLAAPAGQPA